MATVIPHREPLQASATPALPPKNVLKSKATNEPPSKPLSKHSLSEEKQFKPHMRKSIERAEVEQNNLLSQKRALKGDGDHPTPLRNIIQSHEEEYRESKPFHKKYGTQNATQAKNLPAPASREEKAERAVGGEGRNKTKQSFNKKLNSNIIKDQEAPTSKQSYRIKKVDNRSPKKIRDDLVALNEEEHKLQMQILELHKTTKRELEQYKATYKFDLNNLKRHFPDHQNTEETGIEQFLHQVAERLRHKKKEQAKIEGKIEGNAYLAYLRNLPEDIMELHSSEEEDEVQELPENRPRLENNVGSYSTAMPGIKDKKHALNLRRTYDIFKEDDRASRMATREAPEQVQDEKTKEDGENRMTVNTKLKDFLLS